MKKISLLLISITFLGCSSSYYLSPIIEENENLDMIYVQGREVAISYKDSSMVAVYGVNDGKEITIRTLLINDSDEFINVFPEDVVINGENEDGMFVRFETFEPERYLRRVKRRQNTALFLTAMSNAINDANAGTSTTTSSGTVSGSDGTMYNYFGTSVTEDEGKRRESQRASQEQLNNQALQNELYRNSLRNGMLLKTTLFPGAYIEGDIKIKHNKRYHYNHLQLEVPFGEERHIIPFEFVKR